MAHTYNRLHFYVIVEIRCYFIKMYTPRPRTSLCTLKIVNENDNHDNWCNYLTTKMNGSNERMDAMWYVLGRKQYSECVLVHNIFGYLYPKVISSYFCMYTVPLHAGRSVFFYWLVVWVKWRVSRFFFWLSLPQFFFYIPNSCCLNRCFSLRLLCFFFAVIVR